MKFIILLLLSFSAIAQNEVFYNDLLVGRGEPATINFEAAIGDPANPKIRFNHALLEWQYSDDGVNYRPFSSLVAGPVTSTDSSIALFDGVTGKLLKDSSVTVDSGGSITTGSLWLGSNSQILSSTGALSLGSGGVITRAMGHFNAYGIVTSNTTTNSTSTGEDAVVSTPTRKVLRFTNGSLESILEIGAGLNSQELVLINSTGREIFLNTGGNISSPDGRATKLNNGSITSLMYDNLSSKWVIGSGSGAGGISKWISGTSYFVDDVVIYSGSIYQSIENNSDAIFDPLKWELLSFDSKISNETESFDVQNIEARRVVKTSNTSALIEPDQDNLLLNGSFEAQNATQGWTTTSLALSQGITGNALDGKKKVCLGAVGSFYQLLTDTDKYHGRQFIARFNIQNPAGREAQACLYDGEDLHKCIDIIQSLEFREYAIKDTFIEGKTFGVIITGNELDGICTDMNSVKLDENEAYVANIEGDYQSEILINVGTLTPTSDLASFTSIEKVSNTESIYTKSTQGITLLRDAEISVSYLLDGIGVPGIRGATIYVDGTSVSIIGASTAGEATPAYTKKLKAGQKITFAGLNGHTSSKLTISAKARSQVINYPDETFSTDINPVYWKATPCGEDEIGCYNTYPYPSSGNTHGTICATPPTQSNSAIRSEGIFLTSANNATATTCSLPARFVLKMPRGLAQPATVLYKDTSRQLTGSLDYFAVGSIERGALVNSYNPVTGDYIIDARIGSGSGYTRSFTFEDGSDQNNGYLVISATKNGGALVNKSPRTLVKVSDPADMPSWYEIYSDGWVRQGWLHPSASGSGVSRTLDVPMASTNYSISVAIGTASSAATASASMVGYRTSSSTTTFIAWSYSGVEKRISIEGYGAASYLLDNFGVKVNY